MEVSLDPDNRVIKRLWCRSNNEKNLVKMASKIQLSTLLLLHTCDTSATPCRLRQNDGNRDIWLGGKEILTFGWEI